MFGLRIPRHTLLLALLVAAVIPYFLNLGVSSIWDANEAFYAQTAREMIENGDYISPSFNFQLRLNKPVLSYWQVALFYHLFGISEWSERMPIALGAVAITAIAFGLGRLAAGTLAGLFAGIVVATSPRFLLLARRIIIDIHITMFTGLVLLLFALSEIRPQRRRLYLSLMYVAAAFGVLSKGPVAVFLPAVAFFVYLASQRRLGDLRRMMLPTGAAIGLAIVVPWYYFVYRAHGWDYIGLFIFRENLGRYADAVGSQSRGLLFYLPVMMTDLFPWSILLPVALWWAVRYGFEDRVKRLLSIWIATIVIFFSLSGTKEDLYILPIVPAEAALIGAVLASACEGLPIARAVTWGLGTAGFLLLATGAATYWLFGISYRYSLVGAIAVSVVALVGGSASLAASVGRRVFTAASSMAAALIVIAWSVVLFALPDFERYKPVRPFAEIIRSRASVGAIVGSYKFALPSMVFYLNRPIMEVVLPDHLRAVFYSSSDIYFVMPGTEYDKVRERLPVTTYVLARQHMFDLKPRNFLEGTELPEFVLVSNRPPAAPQQ